MAQFEAKNLPAALRAAAAAGPGVPLVFPDTGDRMTLRELADGAQKYAAFLLRAGVTGTDVVGVLAATGPWVLPGIIGVTAAGAAVSVLPTPPALRDPAALVPRLAGLVRASGLRFLLADPAQRPLADLIQARCPELTVLDLTPDNAVPDADIVLPDVSPDDVAVLQYTSGSTSRPKGVVLRHRTVLAGLRSIADSAGLHPRDVFVHWVPHFHDMGLFGWLACVLTGIPTHTFGPAGFVRRPADFLRYFAARGGTLMTGPNFGYDLLLDAVDDDLVRQLDLSRWRLAFNGAEPVSAATVRSFAARFGPAGAPVHAMYPVYGMAEATLAIAFPSPGEPPHVLYVDRNRLTGLGEVRATDAADRAAKALVSVGRPVAGIDVRIVDAAGGTVGERALGEIQIRGEGVTDGYHHDEAATRAAFQDGWLRTGDLGFFCDGRLYVAGRSKDMIIVKGENFFAADVEALVRDMPGVHRRHCVAVPAEAERLAVVAETPDLVAARADGLADRIRQRITAELGLGAVTVHLVAPGALPRTTSGKWQRGLVRAQFGRMS